MEPGDHLFRRESGRMVAALTRIFGVHNLALAEDVVQDAFCRALEVWRIRGVPENSSAWLMAAAKNRALDVLRRERTARTFAPELGRFLQSEWTLVPIVEELFTADAIKDDLLRMMFSCCDPRLPEQAQVAVVLHILCAYIRGTSNPDADSWVADFVGLLRCSARDRSATLGRGRRLQVLVFLRPKDL